MGRIDAIQVNGLIIKDIQVFQEAYDLIGLGWIYFPKKLPLAGGIVNVFYKMWAKYS